MKKNKCSCSLAGARNDLEECAAIYLNPSVIHTDEKRFQNRQNKFSAESANEVAENFDENRLDPIVVFNDDKDKKIYVLSGHSRFSGLKKRKEKKIPVRFFKGTEEQAVLFAKIYGNRLSDAETLTEDLKAFRLMKEQKAKRKDLQSAFKKKLPKLELLAYLNPLGKFIFALDQANVSEFPYLETRAQWVGQFRKENKSITNEQERDIFNYLYSNKKGYELKKDALFELLKKRALLSDERLFPECDDNGNCKSIQSYEEVGADAVTVNKILFLEKELKMLRALRDNKARYKPFTKEERIMIARTIEDYEFELSKYKKDLNVKRKTQSALF